MGYRWRNASIVSALIAALYDGIPRYRRAFRSARRVEHAVTVASDGGERSGAWPAVAQGARKQSMRERCGGWADLHARHSTAKTWQGGLF